MSVENRVREGLIARGMPPHVAEAFILNFQDESGLNPDINERNPIVPGSRGGRGLYQLTGPRRRAFESRYGEDGYTINNQLDFLMYELEGPESRAAQSIFAAENTPDAAVAIVKDFLRPLETHQRSRAARYRNAETPSGNALSYGMDSAAAPPTSNALSFGMAPTQYGGMDPAAYDMGEPVFALPMPSFGNQDDDGEREADPFAYRNRLDPAAFRLEPTNALAPTYRRYA